MLDDLKRIRAFIAVCDHGTITAAAIALRIAQPAISRQIQALERETGVELFSRNGPRLQLTQAGRYLLPAARELIAQSEHLQMAAQEVAYGELTRLSIAVAPTTLSEILAPFIAHLGDRAPYVTVESVGGSGVHEAVVAYCDFGISAEPPPVHDLDWARLISVPLRAYVSQRHKWAQENRQNIRIEELLDEHLILPPVDDPTRTAFDVAISTAGAWYGHHTDLPFPRIVQATATAGHGVGIATDLPRFDAHPLFIHAAPNTPLRLDIHACWSRQHFAASALNQLAQALFEFTQDQVGPAAWRL